MRDPWHNFIKSVFSHNRYLAIAVILGVAWNIAGCTILQSKVADPMTGEQVTGEQLSANYNRELSALELSYAANLSEIDRLIQENSATEASHGVLNEDYDAAFSILSQKRDEQRGFFSKAFDLGVTAFPPASPLVPFKDDLLTLVAGGLILDNRRKSKIIKTAKAGV